MKKTNFRIFGARNSSLLENFYERVHPKDEVERFRKTVLVQKMKAIEGDPVNSSNLSSFPEELQVFFKYQKACERLKAAEEKNERLRAQERELIDEIKKNGKFN